MIYAFGVDHSERYPPPLITGNDVLRVACHSVCSEGRSRVVRDDFSDAALVLLGHGTTLNAGSGTPVMQHAAELRRRRIFGEVREAFWKQEPKVVEVGKALNFRRVFYVPLFISEGYFSDEVIPRALGFEGATKTGVRVKREGEQTFFYCKPVGTHSSMTRVLLKRAQEVVQKFPFPRAPKAKDITLVIAGHGTEQNENSRVAAEQQVNLIRSMDLYADVHAVFLDEDPRIPSCFDIAQTRNMVVVPFFISEGLHVAEDIPVLLGEPERIVQQRLKAGQPTWRNPSEKKGKLIWYSGSVGTDPLMSEVILDLVREAGAAG